MNEPTTNRSQIDKLVRLSDVTAAMNSEGYTKNMRVHKKVLSIPAVDAVKVVRCADCKHWDGPDDGYTHSCDVDAWVRPGWWFCPAGQRREDGAGDG